MGESVRVEQWRASGGTSVGTSEGNSGGTVGEL